MQPHGSHNAQLTGVVDSFVGAIVQEGSDDDGDGEVVEEWGMFQQCYKGHCNLSLNKGVSDMLSEFGFAQRLCFLWAMLASLVLPFET